MKTKTRALLIGTGVASIAAIVVGAGACASGKRIDLVSDGADALASTEGIARSTASSSSALIEASVERFRELFDRFDPESTGARAVALYADDAYFNDGFAELRGSEAIASYLAQAARGTKALEVQIEDVTLTADGAYVRWIMTFTTHYRSLTVAAPGISHLRFDSEGRIVYHRDYWDASAALAEFVPFAGSILRAIRARF